GGRSRGGVHREAPKWSIRVIKEAVPKVLNLPPERGTISQNLAAPLRGGCLNRRSGARQPQVDLAVHPTGTGNRLGLGCPAVHVVHHLVDRHLPYQGCGSSG